LVTTTQQGKPAGDLDPPSAPAGTAPTFAGLSDGDVQDLYDAVGRIAGKQLVALRRLRQDAEGRLRLAMVEQQQLAQFLDEVDYRIRYLSEAPESAEIVARRARLEAQQQELRERQGSLSSAQHRLEHLSSRIGWLVRQIEVSVQRIDAPADGAGDSDPWDVLLRAQLIQGQEAERSRLAREIHDGPAQALTNTLLRLQFLEGILTARPDEAARELAQTRTSVRDSLRDVRRFIFNLRPASLKEVGLVGTLQRMISEYREHTELEVQASLPETLELDADQELVVFRVVQEALHNIQKHAGAGRVEVEVARRPGGCVITVADDGRGFTPAPAQGRPEIGSGLVSMRERAAIVGGSLEVTSAAGCGTRLTLTIPLPDADPAPGVPGSSPAGPGG
jgi:two-component system, NarL family, sensor histidine kinase DegS